MRRGMRVSRSNTYLAILGWEWPAVRHALRSWLHPSNFGRDGAQKLRLSEPGRNRYGVQGGHLNPLGLFLCTSIPCIWSILTAFLPS
jgi:hypothetical protein